MSYVIGLEIILYSFDNILFIDGKISEKSILEMIECEQFFIYNMNATEITII